MPLIIFKKNIRILKEVFRNSYFRWAVVLSLILLFLAIVISEIESPLNEPFRSIVDVIYFTAITVTTIGYGDITVKQDVSKILDIFMILIGVFLMSILTATFASVFTATRIREGMGLKKIDLSKHIVICGFNENIVNVINALKNSSPRDIPDIVLVNSRPENDIRNLIDLFPDLSLKFVYGDFITEPVLMRAGINKASSAIILADKGIDGLSRPDDRTLLASLTIKSLSKDIELVAEVTEHADVSNIKKAGVDHIVLTGEFSGFLLANAVLAPGVLQAVKEIMTVEESSEIKRIPIPHDLIGKTFAESFTEFYLRFGNILIGIITEKESFNLESVLSSEGNAIDDFIRHKFSEAGRNLDIEAKGRINVSINPAKSYIISDNDSAIVIIHSDTEKRS